MIKRLIIYFLPIFLFCGAQASAFKLSHHHNITQKKYYFNTQYAFSLPSWQNFISNKDFMDDGDYSESWIGPYDDFTKIYINGDLQWNERYCSEWLNWNSNHQNQKHAPVPEPATVVLISMGLIAFTYRRVRRLSR